MNYPILQSVVVHACGKEFNKFCPPKTDATTFAFSSVVILLLCFPYTLAIWMLLVCCWALRQVVVGYSTTSASLLLAFRLDQLI